MGATKINHLIAFAVSTTFLVSFAAGSSAQEAKDIVGSWAHVPNINTAADGKNSYPFASPTMGQAIFGSES